MTKSQKKLHSDKLHSFIPGVSCQVFEGVAMAVCVN